MKFTGASVRIQKKSTRKFKKNWVMYYLFKSFMNKKSCPIYRAYSLYTKGQAFWAYSSSNYQIKKSQN